MRLRFYCIIFLVMLHWPGRALAYDDVTVLLSEEGGVYAEFATQLRASLPPSGGAGAPLRVLTLASAREVDFSRTGPGQLVVAVGAPAMAAIARKPTALPVLNVLVSRNSFRSLARSGGRAADSRLFSAIYFDQPWARQFALIRFSVPGRRVGILLGKESAELMAPLQTAARDAHMTAHIELISDEADLLPALKRLLTHSDALLAVPDSAIYNRNNIAPILLTSYRAKVPLFGFSASYVKAGALAAVYSQPGQIAQQVAEIIQSQRANGGLPAPQSPRYFSVGVNPLVRLSLELSMDDEPQLLQRLQQLTVPTP